MTSRRRTGPAISLLVIGLGLVAAGVVVGLVDGKIPGSEQLADALPAAGLAVLACSAVLVATGRTAAMTEVRGLAWVFLSLVFLGPLIFAIVVPDLLFDPLLLGVLGSAGLAVLATLASTPPPRRPEGRPFTAAFGGILTVGIVLAAVSALLAVLAPAVPPLWVPAVLLGTATVIFLAAMAALLAARRVQAVPVVRLLAAAYLVGVYLVPFVVALLLAERSFDGLAAWFISALLVIGVLVVAGVVVATLAYDSAMRRRRTPVSR